MPDIQTEIPSSDLQQVESPAGGILTSSVAESPNSAILEPVIDSSLFPEALESADTSTSESIVDRALQTASSGAFSLAKNQITLGTENGKLSPEAKVVLIEQTSQIVGKSVSELLGGEKARTQEAELLVSEAYANGLLTPEMHIKLLRQLNDANGVFV